MPDTTRVSIVIPNWNGYRLLEKHLPSVIAASLGGEVLVVDDASDDESVPFLTKTYRNIRVIEKKTHDGFAATVNVGVREARGDIVVLLNTDLRPHKNFLKPLLAHFSDPNVFAVGCMDISHEQGEKIKRGRGLARWGKGFFIHSRGEVEKNDTAWVSGGSAAFRKNMWIQLGGMDELYNPFYWEDIDVSYRALKAGYKIVFEPESVTDHFHEEGKIAQNFSAFTVRATAARNQFTFIWKNLSDPGIWIEHIMWTPVRLAQAAMRADFAFLLGYAAAAVRFPNILIRRQKESKFWTVKDTDIPLPMV